MKNKKRKGRKTPWSIGSLWRGRHLPAAVRLKMSLKIKKLRSEGKWKRWTAEKLGKHLSASTKRKLRISVRKAFQSEALRKRIDRSLTAWWRAHPNIRRIRSKKMKEELIKHPEAMKRFLENSKNSSKVHLKTKQGFIVRSKGEKEIANFLFDNRIKSFYEAKPLQLDGNLCVPDFWLPEYKCYIEFYGGYPGAWKKKVMKNKLYKKYKIRCIFITPNELGDLDYYLIKELR